MKKIIFIIGLMLMTQNALGNVKCNLFQDSKLKYHCNKMKKIEKKLQNLKPPSSASNLSFLLFDRDVELTDQAEFELLQDEARKSDKKEFEQKQYSLEKKRFLHYKHFLLRKQDIRDANEATKKRNTIYGLIEEEEAKPKKRPNKKRGKKPIKTYDAQYGWVETYVW